MICASAIYVEEEPDEVAVVEMAHAVVYPRTVMVYSPDVSAEGNC